MEGKMPNAGNKLVIETAPWTNGDAIRDMTDEELAEWLAKQKHRKITFDGWLPLCYHAMGPKDCSKRGCEKCWLDWLRQEATDGKQD